MQTLIPPDTSSAVCLSCSILADISVLKLKADKCSRQDNLFMKKVRISLLVHPQSTSYYLLLNGNNSTSALIG